jgi:hypothetical protein
MKPTTENAVALLERSDPVAQDGLARAESIAITREKLESLIAGATESAPRFSAGRRTRGRRRAVVLAVTAVAAAGVVFLALPGTGHQSGGVLSEAAALAAQQPPTLAPPGSYYYLDELDVQVNSSDTSGPKTRTNVQWWVAKNGSGRVTSIGYGSAGPRTETFGPGKYDSIAYPAPAQMNGHYVVPPVGQFVPLSMRFDPEQLPTDPAALGRALRAEVAIAARLARYGYFAETSIPEGTKELSMIAYALQDPMDSPALRSALFTVAGQLPGITVQRGARDPLGRPGEAITASEGVAVEEDGKLNRIAHEVLAVLFDSRTTQILAETQYASDHPDEASDQYTVFSGQVDVPTDTSTSKAAH